MSSNTINARSREGREAVLAAGIYYLDTALKLETGDQVLLGLGIPTLVTNIGEPAIQVGSIVEVDELVRAELGARTVSLYEAIRDNGRRRYRDVADTFPSISVPEASLRCRPFRRQAP